MPSPTFSDPWLADRRFGIVIDAGSSGSRLQIYSWKDPRTIDLDKHSSLAHSLPVVEKGAREGEKWVTKVEPGLSSFTENTEGIAGYLAPLLSHARDLVPPSLQSETPIFLLATAGMRLLSPTQQADILLETCKFLKYHSSFRIDNASSAGPCGSSVRIITGEEEGLFGWIAVNYLMDGFTGSGNDRTTFGFLDMGGASTQIAFEPGKAEQEDTPNLISVRLRQLGGEEILHKVFVTTWLGYGTNQARERYVAQAINGYEKGHPEGSSHESTEGEIIHDPCLPKDLQLMESPLHTGPSTSHTRKPHTLMGTGSFEQCLRNTSSLLNKDAPCPDSPCLFNGVHVPRIDFGVSHFIGVSEYWYSSDHVFNLGGPYDFVQYERAASEFCARDWSSIVKEHEESRNNGIHTGDGEVEEGGRVVATGKWGEHVEISRLEMQCFKAAWIANVLHEGIGMPRIVDPGGNNTTDGDKVVEQAESKGLGRPLFQSLDTVDDIAISWTLGKMVLEASREVPPLSAKDRPLGDPLDDIPESEDFPIKPIRPPFFDLDVIEDRLSRHLPSSLSRSTLGFSPILFLFYVVVTFIIIAMTYQLRHRLGVSWRRIVRGTFKRDRDLTGDAMEQGKTLNGSSRPPSPTGFWPFRLLYTMRRMLSRHTAPRPLTVSIPKSPLTNQYQNGGAHANSTGSSSRPASPLDDEFTASNSISSLSSVSRSRNSSQLNLSTLMPRQGQLSRGGSALLPPVITSLR